MADWKPGSSMYAKRYATSTFIEYKTGIWWDKHGYVGRDENNVIQLIEDFTREPGNSMRFYLTMVPEGDPIVDDDTLEGNEMNITNYYQDVTLHEYRGGIRLYGNMEEKAVAFNMRETARKVLGIWKQQETGDAIFSALASSPTKVIYGGTATSTSNLTSSDLCTLKLLLHAATYAESVADPRIPPLIIDGEEKYIVILHKHCLSDMQLYDSDFRALGQSVYQRNSDNPLIKRAAFVYNNLIVYSTDKIPTADNWGASGDVHGATNLLLGAQAALLGRGKTKGGVIPQFDWREQTWDYGHKYGIAVGETRALAKTVFNSKDFSTVAIRTAANSYA